MRTVLAVCAALLLTAAGAAQQPVSCRAQAWAIAAQGDFRTAANALALCSAAAAEPAQSAADLLLLARLAQTENALQQRHWWSAAAGMQALAAAAPAALPPALETTLAPALIRFGSGSPAAAATLARVPARRHTAMALPFQAFLRHQYVVGLWRSLALPGIAVFLLVLIASLGLGLRTSLRRT